ncbi:MAG TPA: AAA family ATPase [bacterium]|nr:AAA family ATPase [bacterium]HPN42509.1 AAA family ATPase [bacterium]
MQKAELIKKSPIRVLESGINGGLGKGNLGVFTARKGVGKTASLVHIATDTMLQERKVLHISFADDPQHLENWYKQVFLELAKQYKLIDSKSVYDALLTQRLILHFKKKDITFTQIRENYKQITQSTSFTPQTIFVDGFPFENAEPAQLQEWKQFAAEAQVEIWFSATLHREDLQLDEKDVPAPVNKFYELWSVIIMLSPKEDFIDFNLLKAHNTGKPERLRLKLDPQTMLIANNRV